ncbi:MAG: hypothetical protein LKG19_14790 [Saprospiraceae bacterium]|jgi:hypothetical protein|nr:hypothetical protein [Saprospiraceae bacterium]
MKKYKYILKIILLMIAPNLFGQDNSNQNISCKVLADSGYIEAIKLQVFLIDTMYKLSLAENSPQKEITTMYKSNLVDSFITLSNLYVPENAILIYYKFIDFVWQNTLLIKEIQLLDSIKIEATHFFGPDGNTIAINIKVLKNYSSVPSKFVVEDYWEYFKADFKLVDEQSTILNKNYEIDIVNEIKKSYKVNKFKNSEYYIKYINTNSH